jgi:hypothetical protein
MTCEINGAAHHSQSMLVRWERGIYEAVNFISPGILDCIE